MDNKRLTYIFSLIGIFVFIHYYCSLDLIWHFLGRFDLDIVSITNGKTNCSIFKKHFVPSSPLLIQNKMCILLQKIEATYSVASIFALNLRKRSTVG